MYSTEFNLKGKNVKLSKEKLLTIGIITKNECEKLERCLKSLMPIKEALDCEIIVTDTGSTDNTLEIAKQYADKIIEFEWIDDFSAARNTGIEASKGLWFMWIDSDEWVDDPKPLIDFFKGGDYKKYASATIEMLDSVAGDNNIGLTLSRILLLGKGARFEGAIHENIPMMGPRKNINAILFHDGYSFETVDQKKEKHNRNLELLLKMYNDDPEDLRVIRYVIDQYRFVNEFEKANELCDRGIELIEKNVELNDADKAYELHFNIMKAANHLSMNKLQECINILNVLEDINPKNSRRFLDIYFMLSESYGRIGESGKSIEFAKMYIESYIKRTTMDSSYSTVFYEISNKSDVAKKMLLLSVADIKWRNKENSIVDYISEFRTARIENNIPQSEDEYILSLFDISSLTKRYELLLYGYEQIKNRYIQFEMNKFKELIFEYIILNREDIYSIATELFKIQENGEPLYHLSKFIILDIDKDYESAKGSLLELMDLKSTNRYIVFEILYGIFKYDMDFESVSENIDIYSSKNILALKLRNYDGLIEYIVDYYDIHSELKNNIRYKTTLINIFNEYICNIKVDQGELIKIYNIYMEFLPDIIKFMYGENISEEKLDFYPPIHRLGYLLYRSNELKKQKDFIGYIGELKKAVVQYPYIERAIIHEIEEIERDLNLENERKNEFEELAVKIKQKVYELITLGEYEEALTVVCQLQSIMPNDSELKELKSRLTSF